MQATKLTISLDEVNSPRVEAKLKERELITRTQEHYQTAQLPTATPRTPRFPWLYNTVVYMGLFGLLGGLLGFTFGEVMHFRPNPRMEARELLEAKRQLETAGAGELITAADAALAVKEIDRTGSANAYYALHLDATLDEATRKARWKEMASKDEWTDFFANVLFYSICGMMIAICLGVADSVVERNWQAAIKNGAVAAGVGLVGGVVISLFVDRLYDLLVGGPETSAELSRQMLARGVSWGVLGLFLTAAPGLVLRNTKKLWIGMVGGLVGGIIGGVLFDPLAHSLGNVHVSRLLAIVVIGVIAGVGTGLIENAAKSGWFKVTAGVIAGKQFVLYRNPTYVGSSPQCHIYLFKDPQVGKRHAAVHIVPGGFEIEDLPLGAKTMVNGKAVTRARLRNGDKVSIGVTSFNFQEKVKSKIVRRLAARRPCGTRVMANLIVEHLSKATGRALDGTLSVGRGADNDIVIDHPTVSRHHGVIERISGEYFLTDLGSRNGTRVNGRTVRERKPIANGAKIRFGQVRVTFLVAGEDPETSTPTLERMPATEVGDPGILFDCLCGTRLWAKTEAAGGIVECRKCNREVVVPEQTTNKDNGETVSGMILSAVAPETLSAPVQTGTCSICQWHTSTEDHLKTCPSCGLTFHEECWNENCGCSAYGCAEVNAHGAKRPRRPERPETPNSPAQDEIVIEGEHDERPLIPTAATQMRRVAEEQSSLPHAMLGASLIGTVLGLMAFGVLALGTLVACLYILHRNVTRRRRERNLMFAAAAISLVGTIAGAAVSSAWWLGVKL